jgi:hypothetical protein
MEWQVQQKGNQMGLSINLQQHKIITIGIELKK